MSPRLAGQPIPRHGTIEHRVWRTSARMFGGVNAGNAHDEGQHVMSCDLSRVVTLHPRQERFAQDESRPLPAALIRRLTILDALLKVPSTFLYLIWHRAETLRRTLEYSRRSAHIAVFLRFGRPLCQGFLMISKYPTMGPR